MDTMIMEFSMEVFKVVAEPECSFRFNAKVDGRFLSWRRWAEKGNTFNSIQLNYWIFYSKSCYAQAPSCLISEVRNFRAGTCLSLISKM